MANKLRSCAYITTKKGFDMINFTEIQEGGELWEFFARDLLEEIGFQIISSPDRGADNGKDILVSEEIKGNLGKYKFTWLVSCKNLSKSNRSVNEKEETNILERMKSAGADGFLGIYSTIASSGLNRRLYELRNTKDIKDYKIFDQKIIESYLVKVGFSHLLMRYFPESYRRIKPIHLIAEEYIPLKCRECGKDLLEAWYTEPGQSIIVFVRRYDEERDLEVIEDIYWCCKGACDRKYQTIIERNGFLTGYEDINALFLPSYFLEWIISIMASIRAQEKIYTDKAFDQLKFFALILSQRVLREMTEKEKKSVQEIRNLPF